MDHAQKVNNVLREHVVVSTAGKLQNMILKISWLISVIPVTFWTGTCKYET
jgi:hypothetical protein